MAKNGLLIDYNFCTGCLSCEVACQQEHDFPVGQCGIKVTEYVMETSRGISINYLPFPTDLCDLCSARTQRNEKPSCVKHCQANCMTFGQTSALVKELDKRPKMVLFKPL
jgi:Fe-S-cluster-containing dehydrogenase component